MSKNRKGNLPVERLYVDLDKKVTRELYRGHREYLRRRALLFSPTIPKRTKKVREGTE